jgi:hypothetical protein
MIFFGLFQGDPRVYNIQGGQTTKSNFLGVIVNMPPP